MEPEDRNNKLYIRVVKRVTNAVFNVDSEGQKLMFDPIIRKSVPFGSGQMVKRQIMSTALGYMGLDFSKMTYRQKVENYGKKGKKKELKEVNSYKEGDPINQPDDQLAGHMRKQENISFAHSAPVNNGDLYPIHPELVNFNNELVTSKRENSDIIIEDDKGNPITFEEAQKELKENSEDEDRVFSASQYVGDQKRASGIFALDIEIECDRIFYLEEKPEVLGVSQKGLDDKIKEAEEKGWKRMTLNNGKRVLYAPEERRKFICDALVYGILNWETDANKSTTFDPMPTLAVCYTYNSQLLKETLATRIDKNDERERRIFVVDEEGSDAEDERDRVNVYIQKSTNEETNYPYENASKYAKKQAMKDISEELWKKSEEFAKEEK